MSAIVRAITGLGQARSLQVVTEGVEDEDTANFLRQIGCSAGQGYLFGKPAPAAEAKLLALARGRIFAVERVA
jgi:EAL domain-containing protein (putative c-di-GMP-specific phosphodiesterase class I)